MYRGVDVQEQAYHVYREIGNRGHLNGEWGWELVKRVSGVVYLDGDFTDEELEEDANIQEVEGYIFRRLETSAGTDWYMYNTRFYFGDFYQYDFPGINEYHHKSVDEIDPGDYELGEAYEETSAEETSE